MIHSLPTGSNAIRFEIDEFHRFFIALSGRPGRCFAMIDQCGPICRWSVKTAMSSSIVHGIVDTDASR
jgi:hypothetical protein